MATGLLFIGAGGLAREALSALRAAPDPPWQPLGFLDDDPAVEGKVFDGLPVLGPIAALSLYPDAAVLLCVAGSKHPGGRRTLALQLGLAPERYATVVHPAASIAMGTEIGPGAILLAGATVTAPQQVGAHAVLMSHTVLTHDDRVGEFVTLACGVRLCGHVTVDAAAYLGAGALVREFVWIGEGAVVGIGAVVLDDIAAGEVWVGNPAQRLCGPESAREANRHRRAR